MVLAAAFDRADRQFVEFSPLAALEVTAPVHERRHHRDDPAIEVVVDEDPASRTPPIPTTAPGPAPIEQVFADLNNSALAHFPSGRFGANAAWLTLAAATHNLLRAAGCLTSVFHSKARTATFRRHLIHIAARTTRSARKTTLHLPTNWPWPTATLASLPLSGGTYQGSTGNGG